MGATGGVGGYAVQIARYRGAHVIATVRGDPEEARLLGAEEVYDSKAVDVIDALRRLTRAVSMRSSILSMVRTRSARDAQRFSSLEAVLSRQGLCRETKGGSLSAKSPRTTLRRAQIPCRRQKGLTRLRTCSRTRTITARIRSMVELDGADQTLEQLRNGGLRGKAVIRL